MKLLVVLVLVTAAIFLIGRQSRQRMDRGTGETGIAIEKIRRERRKRHGA